MLTTMPSTLVSVLCDAVQKRSEAALFTYLRDGEDAEVSLTRGALDVQARAIAAELVARGLSGRRVLLLYVPGLDFTAALFACLYAKVVAVPAYPPDPSRLSRTLPRLLAIIADCEPALVLTTTELAAMAPLIFAQAPGLAAVPWAASDTWALQDPSGWTPICPHPEDLALIQYTSGSTSQPKGVQIGHDNLLANLRQLQHARRGGEHTTIVSWLPFYHDLGLIGSILLPVFLGGRAILLSPTDFLKRPFRWLRAIDKYRADTSAAPNFALDVCVRKVSASACTSLDLSCWTMALIGAEPLQRATLARFCNLLAPSGFDPRAIFQGYGLAEAVLASVCGTVDAPFRSGRFDAVALRDGLAVPVTAGDGPTRELVSCGTPVVDQRVEIVDPATRMRCEPGRIGEIWLAGPNVARGYWNHPADTLATFGAFLASPAEGPFLSTGDLGFVADGEIYVTGRIKDLIIICGKNHHPQDIEQTVDACHAWVRPGCTAAFAIEVGTQERLVVVAEVDLRALPPGEARRAALAEVMAAIRRAVGDRHDLKVHAVALIAPGQLPKTSSGKAMRHACRSDFLSGSLGELERSTLPPSLGPETPAMERPVLAGRTEAEIAAWLRSRIAQHCGLLPKAITGELAFVQLGLDSQAAMGLVGELETDLARSLPATLLYDYPSVSALARFLTQAEQKQCAEASLGEAATAHHARHRPGLQGLDPATSRICIIGAGAAGLTAAYELANLGYRHITVLEKEREVGGKVHSVQHGGRAYELGQAFYSNRHHETLKLLRAFDLVPEPQVVVARRIDAATGRLTAFNLVETYSWIVRVLAAAGVRDGGLELRARHDAAELWVPMLPWLDRHGLLPIPAKILEHWVGFGYGLPNATTPIWYLLSYLPLLLGITSGESSADPSGNQRLWSRVAQHLTADCGVEVLTNVSVQRVQRGTRGVRVLVDDLEERVFDELILACPPRVAHDLLEPSAPERELLAAFQSYDYVVSLVVTEGLGKHEIVWREPGRDSDWVGELLAMRHLPATGVVTTAQYGSPLGRHGVLSGAELQARVRTGIAALGGRVIAELTQKRWQYFPHLSPADMERGILRDLEAHQGAERTYFVGSYMSFESIEHTVAYAKDLVRHFFAPPAEKKLRQETQDEPVAIIGMGCRFPGGVTDPESFWRLLDQGEDAITEVPKERWDIDAYYDSNPDAKGKMTTRWGGFLTDLDQFAPEFFGISPREAVSIDPQQRLLLETSWEALERAGQTREQLLGSETGVYIGLCGNEYQSLTMSRVEEIDAYSLLGTAHSASVGRLSYWLGLKGPNVPVDTACSSSLVAIHLACQALRSGECAMALAGGVNLVLSPEGTVFFSRLRALSPTGRCHTFSEDADGYVRSEGCGVVVLKPLAAAQRDGDPILAVIRGSAVNQDGRSNGLTAPNGSAQEAVIKRALKQAGIAPAQVGYVETHGTGTPLGDPIEVQALGAALGSGRAAAEPVVLGSVKTNLGHTEGAAGVAGLIKTVLCLQHGVIPKNLHFRAPNRHIAWSELKVQVATQARPWRVAAGSKRVAGVSSFGFSGTNAHVVLEEAPERKLAPWAPERAAELMVLSAHSEAAVSAQAGRLGAYLQTHPELPLCEVAQSLVTTRSAMEHRLAIAATTREQLHAALQSAAQGQTPPGAVRGTVTSARGKLAFLFTGQGAQLPGMGRGLYAAWPVFREAFDRCLGLFDRELVRPLREVMWAPPDSADAARLDQTAYTQPALFALEYALYALWQCFGITPDYVAGHSLGELVAACVAGVFSLEDAARLCAARGRLMQALPAGGAMVSIAAAEAEVAKAVAPQAARVAIAAVNGPKQVVIAGEEAVVAALAAGFAARGVHTRKLAVSHAFHSPLMEPMLEPFRRVAETVRYHRPAVALVSTRSGKLSPPEVSTAEYWVEQVREAVRFAQGIQRLHQEGVSTLVEVGPQATLLGLVPGCVPKAELALLASLRREREESGSVLQALGGLWTQGRPIEWTRVLPAGGRRVPLPTYPWQRQRYWVPAPVRTARELSQRGHAGGHPLLGVVQTLSTQTTTRLWDTTLDLWRLSWLGDHRVQGAVVFPGAAYLEMALWAGREALGQEPFAVTDVALVEALVLVADTVVPVQLVTTEEQPGQLRFQVATAVAGAERGSYRVNARGILRRISSPEVRTPLDLAALRARMIAGDPARVYAALTAMGLQYGAAFQGITELWRGEGEALGRVKLPQAAGSPAAYVLHPALLDACFQVLTGALTPGAETTPWVPIGVGCLRLLQGPEEELFCYVRMVTPDSAEATEQRCADLWVVNSTGACVAEITGLVLKRLASGPRRAPQDDWFLEQHWETGSVPAPKPGAGRWLLLGGGAGVGSALRAALETAGQAVVHIAEPPPNLRAVLAESFAGKAPTAVVHLGALDGSGEFNERALEIAMRHGCDSVLATVQALAGQGYRDAPRLWLITRGAQALGDGQIAVAQAPLLGLGRVIAIEHGELRCGRIDLDPSGPASEVAALLAELLADDAEEEVALRGGQRRVARLVHRRTDSGQRPPGPGELETAAAAARIHPQAESGVTIRPDGSYLVTGGLGGLGLSAAGWLAEQGAGQLILLGRAGAASAEQKAAVAVLAAKGTRVTVAAADVAQRAALEPIFRAIADSGMPLRGVIHAAGLLDDGLLLQQTPARLRAVMAPKVQGALHLHELTRDLRLDFFVLYSSAAGLLGSPGQGSYAAANTFLDALAHHRRTQRLPALSIAWGAFSEVGLAAAQDNRGARLAARGAGSLTPAQGLVALARLLASRDTQVAVVPLDLQRWAALPQAVASSRRLSRLWPEQRRAGSQPAFDPALRERLAAADPEARVPLLEEVLRAEVAQVLQIPAAKLDVRAPLTNLGMDSLMGLELRNRIEAALGIPIPATLLWSYPTVTALSAHLAGQAVWVKNGEGVRPPVPPMDELAGPLAEGSGVGPDHELSRPPLARFGATTLLQRAMYDVQRAVPESGILIGAIEIRGLVDPARVRDGLRRAMVRHPMLACSFVLTAAAELVTTAASPAGEQVPLLLLDERGESLTAAEHNTRAALTQPLPLDRGLPWRAVLVRRDETRWVFGVAMHHAIMDATSRYQVMLELVGEGVFDDGGPVVPIERTSASASFDAFVNGERQLLATTGRERLSYWQAQLAGAVWPHLMGDLEAGPVPRFTMTSAQRLIPQATAKRLDDFAFRLGVGSSEILLWAWSTVLRQASAAERIVVAMVVSLRGRGSELVVGPLYDYLPVVSAASVPGTSCGDEVRGVATQVRSGLEQRLPYAHLAARIGEPWGPGAPLCGTLYNCLDLRWLPRLPPARGQNRIEVLDAFTWSDGVRVPFERPLLSYLPTLSKDAARHVILYRQTTYSRSRIDGLLDALDAALSELLAGG